MRFLELWLVIGTIAAVFLRGRTQRFSRIIAATLFLSLILHLLIDQPRWQMFSAYIVILSLIIITLRHLNVAQFIRKRLTTITLITLSLISLILGIVFPIFEPPPLKNRLYDVGTFSTQISYDERDLMMQVWYPADIDPDHQPLRATYIPNIEIAGPVIAKRFNLPSFLLDHINLIEPHAYQSPEIATTDQPFPVLLFSHGYAGLRVQNTLQIEHLVSQGYVVAATDHHPSAIMTVLADDTVIPIDYSIVAWDTTDEIADSERMVEVWTADLTALADQLEAWQWKPSSPLYAAIDPSQIGVFGHSTGGGTAYQFCARDDRCTATLGFDPWMQPMQDGIVQAGANKPMLAMTTDHALGEENMDALSLFHDTAQSPAWWLTVAGTTHEDFTDFPHLSPALNLLGISGSVASTEMNDILNAYTTAFFDYHLRDQSGALLYLEAEAYPAVTIRAR